MSNKELINLDIPEIKEYQQNRYPLLFIDKIESVLPGKYAKGIKCFTYNEWYFPAHFEDEPSVPGFIQIESLVQTFLMTFLTLENNKGKKTNFVSIDNVKFRKMIVPGDTLHINAHLESFKRGIAKGFAESFVNNEPACRADFIVSIPDILNTYKPNSL